MTIERPMFPPRAESVDSFSLQPDIGQRERECRLSESREPPAGLSRRFVLAGVASAAALPIAGALPTTAEAAADPAFALIAEKRAAGTAYDSALDVLTEAENRYGVGSAEAEDVYERVVGPPCDRAYDASWQLATTRPTTLAGVAAVLRFVNEIEDGGMEWPATDTVGTGGWHYPMRATMAAAIEAIIHEGVA
jgi:hypothetical protein